MRSIKAEDITRLIANNAREVCIKLPGDTLSALNSARENEQSPTAKSCLDQLLHNSELALKNNMPLCQDTGMCVIFMEIGQDCHIEGDLVSAVNEGVRQAYVPLRKSVLHPITRVNTKDNTPCILHTFITSGENIKMTIAPKGFGSENMSRLYMLTPSAGRDGIKSSVLETVRLAGANPCPPIVVGVGIGGTMEYACLLAKKALLRPLGLHNADAEAMVLEYELLDEINALGIGAQGVGGTVTALGVNIEIFPTHIAGLPVAINMQCNCARHIEIII